MIRTKFIKAARGLLVVSATVLTTGCASTACCLTTAHETEGSIRYTVIGFGVISIPKPKEQEEIFAAKMKAVGLVVTNQPGLKVGLGYSSSSVISIPSNTDNAVVEVRTCGDDGISVNAKSSRNF